MALSELPSTDIRRNGIAIQSHLPHSGEKPASSIGGASTIAPISIQSMLKTTTEIGDVELFAGSHPSSQLRKPIAWETRRLSIPFDASAHNDIPQYQSLPSIHGPRSRPSISSIGRHDTVKSNKTSYRSGYHRKSRRMSSSGPISRHILGGSRPLHSHRSTMTLRSYDGAYGVHPRSPHSAVTWKQRMRSDSPAFSETQDCQSLQAYRATSLTSSQSSVFRRGKGPYTSGFNWDYNRSASSLGQTPSPSLIPVPRGFRASPLPSRTVTPVSMRLSSPPVLIAPSYATPTSLQRSHTGSSTRYFDYSENYADESSSFYEHNHLTLSSPFPIEQTIHEDEPMPTVRQAQTPFGILPGSMFVPLELAAQDNQTQQDGSDNGIRLSATHRLNTSSTPSAGEPDQNGTVDKSLNVNVSEQLLGKSTRNPEIGMTVTFGRTPNQSNIQAASIPKSAAPSEDSIVKSLDISRPSTETVPVSAIKNNITQKIEIAGESPTTSRNGRPFTKSTSLALTRPGASLWQQLPLPHFRPLSSSSFSQFSRDLASSTDSAIESEPSGIFSPTPERPVSVQNKRDRFGKILGIEEHPHTTSWSSDKEVYWEIPSMYNPDGVARSPVKASSYHSTFAPLSEQRTRSALSMVSQIKTASHQSSQSRVISHDMSTLTSLLDKHIEALELQPEASEEPPSNKRLLIDPPQWTSQLSSGVKFYEALNEPAKWKGRVRSATVTSTEEVVPLEREQGQSLAIVPINANIAPKRISSIGSTARFLEMSTSKRPTSSWLTFDSTEQFAQDLLCRLGADPHERNPPTEAAEGGPEDFSQLAMDREQEDWKFEQPWNYSQMDQSSKTICWSPQHVTMTDSTGDWLAPELRLSNTKLPSTSSRTPGQETPYNNGSVAPTQSTMRQAISMDVPRPMVRSPSVHRRSMSDHPTLLYHLENLASLSQLEMLSRIRPSKVIRRHLPRATARPDYDDSGIANSKDSGLYSQNTSQPLSSNRPQHSQSNSDVSLQVERDASLVRPISHHAKCFVPDNGYDVASITETITKVTSKIIQSSKPKSTELNRSKIHGISELCGPSGPPVMPTAEATVPMLDFVYKKRKILERLKEWCGKHKQRTMKRLKKIKKHQMKGVEAYRGV